MPRVSKWNLDPKRLATIREDFWAAVTLLENKKQVREFLSQFLTPSERTMLAKRFQVIMMLVAGYDYGSIKSWVHVSLDTVCRLVNRLAEDEAGVLGGIAERISELKQRKVAELESAYGHKGIPGDLLTPLAKVISAKSRQKLFTGRRRKSV